MFRRHRVCTDGESGDWPRDFSSARSLMLTLGLCSCGNHDLCTGSRNRSSPDMWGRWPVQAPLWSGYYMGIISARPRPWACRAGEFGPHVIKFSKP